MKAEYKIIKDFFLKKYKENGKYNVKSIGWNSLNSQQIRFNIFLEYIKNEQNILDVGCGFGDFCKYAENKNLKYTGIDINEFFIEDAKQRNLKNAKFLNQDIYTLNEEFDWVIASGIFCYNINNYEKYVHDIINQMYKLAKIGVMANFLSKNSENQNPETKYVYVDEIYKVINLKVPYIIRHDYKNNDFTIIIKKK